MGEVKRARLKVALSRHYAAQRGSVEPEALDALAQAMAAADARAARVGFASGASCGGRRMGHAAFVAAQVRFIPAWTWAAQVALVALMVALACMAGDARATKLAIGMLSSMTVLVGAPTMASSKRHSVAELEYACPNNAASVLVARLVVLGCSSAFVVAVMVAAVSASVDARAFEVALWAVPPFFFSCAGSLMAQRLASPSTAVTISAVWALSCCGLLAVFANAVPEMYANASLAVWMGAAVIACAWLAREVACTFRAVTQGLDSFSPYMAQTHN